MKATIDAVEYEHIEDAQSSEERGEPCIGIRAKATVRVFPESSPKGHAVIVPITSAGLWGVERASSDKYISEVEQEERAALAEILAAFGLQIADPDADADADAELSTFTVAVEITVEAGDPTKAREEAGKFIADGADWQSTRVYDAMGEEVGGN